MASCRLKFTNIWSESHAFTPTLSGTGSKSTSVPRDVVGCDAARVAQLPSPASPSREPHLRGGLLGASCPDPSSTDVKIPNPPSSPELDRGHRLSLDQLAPQPPDCQPWPASSADPGLWPRPCARRDPQLPRGATPSWACDASRPRPLAPSPCPRTPRTPAARPVMPLASSRSPSSTRPTSTSPRPTTCTSTARGSWPRCPSTSSSSRCGRTS